MFIQNKAMELLAILPFIFFAQHQESTFPGADLSFEKLHAFIKPQEWENQWEQIPWLLDLWEARLKANAENKPIYLWSAGGAPPIGAC